MSPRLPSNSPPPPPSQGSAVTIVVLIAMIAIACGLIALVSVVLPQAMYLVLVVAGFCAFVVLHYFTWGQWLSRMRERERESEEEFHD